MQLVSQQPQVNTF